MKRFSTLLAIAFFTTSLFSQETATVFSKWKISNVGLTLGGDIEMPHGLGYKYLLSTAQDVDFDYQNLPFGDGDLVRMECDNPTARLSLTLAPPGDNGLELQLSFLSIEGRIDMVEYKTAVDDPMGYQHLEVSAINKETAIEGLLSKKIQWTKAMSVYPSVGLNVGYSNGGEVKFKGYLLDNTGPNDVPSEGHEVDLTYQQRNSINQRLYLQLGWGVRFLKRMEFGIQWGKGFGYRATLDGPFAMTTLKRTLGLSLKYSFL